MLLKKERHMTVVNDNEKVKRESTEVKSRGLTTSARTTADWETEPTVLFRALFGGWCCCFCICLASSCCISRSDLVVPAGLLMLPQPESFCGGGGGCCRAFISSLCWRLCCGTKVEASSGRAFRNNSSERPVMKRMRTHSSYTELNICQGQLLRCK